MSINSTATLLEQLERCRLLDPSQLEQLRRHRHALARDPRVLARQLVEIRCLTPFQVNELFAGRSEALRLGSYVLLERIGEGGMGQVFKARHETLDRIVALKVLPKGRLADADLLRRFRREIRLVAQLSHPNIILAFDADQVGEVHFLVMEYVPGIDLAQLVAQKGRRPVAEACEAIRQAALGLQYAHEKGLVHRDIKPSNLLLATHGNTIKLLDLGLARLHDTTDGPSAQVLARRRAQGKGSSSMTQTGKVIGTPDYIAPEQARNSHLADGRADLYSLGCTFYCLLTGQVPFPNGTAFEKLCRHQEDTPAPVTTLRPDVPHGVSAILNKLLAKSPADRFQTGGELAAALARLLRSKRSDRPGNGGADAPHTTLVEGSRPRTAVARGQTRHTTKGAPDQNIGSGTGSTASRHIRWLCGAGILMLAGLIAAAVAIHWSR